VSLAIQAGLCLYVLNMLVGTAAKLRGTRFGVWHHVLYAVVFAAALVATIVDFHPALLVTLAALAAMPTVSARTVWHPVLATVGLAGWVAAVIS
jgi:hypothetical protein